MTVRDGVYTGVGVLEVGGDEGVLPVVFVMGELRTPGRKTAVTPPLLYSLTCSPPPVVAVVVWALGGGVVVEEPTSSPQIDADEGDTPGR